ncbi:protein phosphatase 2C domain-containing protein [Actinoallomurus soli]|uniref:protein phosphatase 2C domain-containing protein n=1 Tax=Actinoallomurus soli TaxID=2952535 RepID=UPI0020938104|nr:protein phosphatase 2C domain-containing protein [Actinoallomurus soli]MCO5974322.1 protein phosphatase 2C domain-containing protein [Actinoallomurus soli]
MQITYATRAAPGTVNEDCVVAGPDWAVVLDGATAPPGVDSGCVHDVAWLVRRLAGALSARLAEAAGGPLTDLVADAIEQVRASHGGTCDLANPDSPSSTLAVTRRRDGQVECLVLADSPIAVRGRDGRIRIVEDDRLAHLPGGRPYTLELVRAHRNRQGGFWVAGSTPEAAHQAVTAAFPEPEVDQVAMFTDGVTRLVEHYGYDWPSLLETVRTGGPAHVIGLVRQAERARPIPGAKPHDDATALLATMPT